MSTPQQNPSIQNDSTTTISYAFIPFNSDIPLQTFYFQPSHTQNGDLLPSHLLFSSSSSSSRDQREVDITPLVRPNNNNLQPGIFAYAYINYSETPSSPNIRATSLAMAMGLNHCRFRGDVFLGRISPTNHQNLNLTHEEIRYGCISPDLRHPILFQLYKTKIHVPEWLSEAARENYRDGESLAALASVMKRKSAKEEEEDDDDDSSASSDETDDGNRDSKQNTGVTTLCLHCRGPCSSLCLDCEGAYFCEMPRRCRQSGWSHQCLCPTWKLYTERRILLSQFSFHDDNWHTSLVTRECQLSQEPYQTFLQTLGVIDKGWWVTELGGWADDNKKAEVDASTRKGYVEGFGGLDTTLLPPERAVLDSDLNEARFHLGKHIQRDERNLLPLQSWEEYYAIRSIPSSSPVALLLTFPLTMYHMIQKYGEVPITVAKMLNRALRVHVVGVEKEMNFLDLFQEVGFLLPEDLKVELTFIVRQDMLPPNNSQTTNPNQNYPMQLNLTPNTTLFLISGTYNDTLDPNFDCGTGPPDMIIGMNAGLYAYPSWRNVMSYLDHHKGVVAVFSDYNEYSGVNCASLGGMKARESLCVNPFRQPRAMPVFCMNLPQFCNGFLYVYNEQVVDE